MSDALLHLPLCVDLDGTLIRGDVLFLGIRCLIKHKPWLLPWFLVWLCLHRAAAKAWLAKEFELDVTQLPYRAELLDYLKQQKAAGRKLYLVSAADTRIVKHVANYLGLFDACFGSDGHTNLKGSRKAAFIQKQIAGSFVYAGDAFADLAVWKTAKGAIVCGKANHFMPLIHIPVEARFAS